MSNQNFVYLTLYQINPGTSLSEQNSLGKYIPLKCLFRKNGGSSTVTLMQTENYQTVGSERQSLAI